MTRKFLSISDNCNRLCFRQRIRPLKICTPWNYSKIMHFLTSHWFSTTYSYPLNRKLVCFGHTFGTMDTNNAFASKRKIPLNNSPKWDQFLLFEMKLNWLLFYFYVHIHNGWLFYTKYYFIFLRRICSQWTLHKNRACRTKGCYCG